MDLSVCFSLLLSSVSAVLSSALCLTLDIFLHIGQSPLEAERRIKNTAMKSKVHVLLRATKDNMLIVFSQRTVKASVLRFSLRKLLCWLIRR